MTTEKKESCVDEAVTHDELVFDADGVMTGPMEDRDHHWRISKKETFVIWSPVCGADPLVLDVEEALEVGSSMLLHVSKSIEWSSEKLEGPSLTSTLHVDEGGYVELGTSTTDVEHIAVNWAAPGEATETASFWHWTEVQLCAFALIAEAVRALQLSKLSAEVN